MNTADPRRWLLVSAELGLNSEADGTGGWWIDHLFLDQDAMCQPSWRSNAALTRASAAKS